MKTKNVFFAIIAMFFSFQNLFATSVPAGNVYGNWTQANSPYLILGNITIPQDSLLTIDPGVVVQFQGHYQLHVLGSIHALGTSGNIISISAVTNWWGIRYDAISATQDSSLFEFCSIEKGNATGTGNYSNGGAFFIINFSKIRIQNCTLINNTAYINGGAIFCDHANPKIISNTFSGNTAGSAYGGAIYCWYASPSIINNTLTYNASSICCKYSSPAIIGNTITHNTVNSTIYCEYSSPSIINNVISYGSMGIYIDRSSPDVIGNVITNNNGADYGAGIRCRYNSSPFLANNTIANNSANIYGGGLYTDYSSSPIIKNTILWGNFAPNNQGTQLALDQTSSPTFYNCDIEGGSAAFYYYDAPNTFTGTYVSNFDSDPLFVNATSGQFSLQSASPCINAGDNSIPNLPTIDIVSNSRICNNLIDLGAYETCATGNEDLSQDNSGILVYPNPSRIEATLELPQHIIFDGVTFELFNIQGEIIKLVDVHASKTKIKLSDVASGIYFLRLKNTTEYFGTKKIIVE
jgi:parallel beta-helix repeat protein/predicted outer membrane repeat protein